MKTPQSTSEFLEILYKSGNQNISPVFREAVSTPDIPWKLNPTTGHLKGVALNDKKVSIQGANLFITGPVNRRVRSDATGFYGTADLPPGKYQLVLESSKNPFVTNVFTISIGNVTTCDIHTSKEH